MGVLSPSLLVYKLFLHDLWLKNVNWDQSLSDDLKHDWLQIIQSGQPVNIPRFINDTKTETTLVLFCDASEKAFGIAAYAVTLNNTSMLIMGKSRMFPNDKTKSQKLSILRKELIALLCATRTAKFLTLEIKASSTVTIFNDSQAALQQICNLDHDSVFVRNRVREINESRSFCEFRYVSTEFNPADIASRGTSLQKLIKHQPWWHGPHFLSKGKENWPNSLILPIQPISHLPLPEDNIQFTQINTIKNSPHCTGIKINVNSWLTVLGIFQLILQFAKRYNKFKNFTNNNHDASPKHLCGYQMIHVLPTLLSNIIMKSIIIKMQLQQLRTFV